MKKFIILILLAIAGGGLFLGFKLFQKKQSYEYLMNKIEEEVILSKSVLYESVHNEIANLKPIQMFVTIPETKQSFVVFREFEQNGESLFLAADLNTLETSILRQEDMMFFENYEEEAASSKFMSLLNANTPISNAPKNGFILFVELVKRTKKDKFERDFFLSLASRENVTPIGIVFSSRWLIEDKANFNKIHSFVEQKKITVTWIHKVLNYANLESEVLNNERLLLESNILPSIFFKIDGDFTEDVKTKLKALSLISVKPSEVIAKGGKLASGKIVVIQGNGSEHKHIKTILNEIEKKKGLQIESLYGNK